MTLLSEILTSPLPTYPDLHLTHHTWVLMTQPKPFLTLILTSITPKLTHPMNFWTPSLVPFFSESLFQHITPPAPVENSNPTSSHTDATPYSHLSNDSPDVPSPITDYQLEHDHDNFIASQQQLHHTNNSLTIHN